TPAPAAFAPPAAPRPAPPGGPARPGPEELALLTRFERLAFTACDAANRSPLFKRASHVYLRQVGARIVHACLGNRMRIDGLDRAVRLAPGRGVVLASNHRSFFDLYAIACVLMRARAPWLERMYFPVRSSYFYERPDGVALNAAIAALSMYPPVLREPARRPFNQFATRLLADLLREPGTMVGIHPEGRRNQDADPYALLPAQPGVGQIVHEARPVVLPVFLRGLTNDFLGQTWQNVTRRGEPLTIVFGEPLELGPLLDEPPRLRTYKLIADRVLGSIAALGERERAFRAGL
ncbi:MAG TPA: lysophospholipid acyltransferase family protein, partial [Polyangiaceae bacterium]|nr:lysophospholipid acyltransferase family protein [Polyangiaceae bacterium]